MKICQLHSFSILLKHSCYPKPDSNALPPSLFWDVLAESKHHQNKSMRDAQETASVNALHYRFEQDESLMKLATTPVLANKCTSQST